jgi:hypothetical protein
MLTGPVFSGRKAIIASLLVPLLGATAIVPSIAAQEEVLEISHKGITLVGVPPDPAVAYDIPVIGAREGVEKVRSALDLLLERSSYSAAVMDTLKNNGDVVIAYDPGYPFEFADSTGVTLAEFFPHLLTETPDPGGQKDFPVIVGRYIVKWKREEVAAILQHELLGHGMQHLHGRLETMSELDRECEARLYQEIAHQDLGMDKHSRVMVAFRQELEWRWCIPFKLYMRKHTLAKMALWKTLNPDVPQLLAIFEDYLPSTGTR